MHVLESQYDLSSIKLGPFLRKPLSGTFVQMKKKFSSIHKFHHHVQVVFVLKRKLKLHDKGVVEHCQDVSLSYVDKSLLIRENETYL